MNHTQLGEHTEEGLHWYQWGREAFARAAAEGKPMRIVIHKGAVPAGSREGRGTVGRLTARSGTASPTTFAISSMLRPTDIPLPATLPLPKR